VYSEPIAYFLTWHTYGTWLHGRAEGSVDKRHNAPNSDRLPPDSLREFRNRSRMKHDPFVLNTQARTLVEQVIREHCELKNWNLHAAAVRTNHVHVVVTARGVRPEQVVRQLKQWGTRRLREKRYADADQRVWVALASTQMLFNNNELGGAIRYTLEGQDRRRAAASVPSASN
jgi:REP element-mobilizing transposase RayT